MGPAEGGNDEGCIPCQRRRRAIRQDDGGGERKRRKDGRKDLSHSAAISVFLVVKKHSANLGDLNLLLSDLKQGVPESYLLRVPLGLTYGFRGTYCGSSANGRVGE